MSPRLATGLPRTAPPMVSSPLGCRVAHPQASATPPSTARAPRPFARRTRSDLRPRSVVHHSMCVTQPNGARARPAPAQAMRCSVRRQSAAPPQERAIPPSAARAYRCLALSMDTLMSASAARPQMHAISPSHATEAALIVRSTEFVPTAPLAARHRRASRSSATAARPAAPRQSMHPTGRPAARDTDAAVACASPGAEGSVAEQRGVMRQRPSRVSHWQSTGSSSLPKRRARIASWPEGGHTISRPEQSPSSSSLKPNSAAP